MPQEDIKEIIWLGDSLKIVREFPKDIRKDFGAALWMLQTGEVPIHSRPMPSVSAGVFELKESDDRTWYRVMYFTKIEETIVVLHSFEKKRRKTSSTDLDTAKQRLKRFLADYRRSK